MTTGNKLPPRPPAKDSDDAWSRVQREASAAIRGLDVDVEELGDTTRTMALAEQVSSDDAPSNEILDLVNASLQADPERSDLWMMRFEVQKTLGLKAEFAEHLLAGWNHPRLGRSLDWKQVGEMWEVLAPGEPAPDGIKLPTAVVESVAGKPAGTPVLGQKRRFSDLATTLAPRELAVLGKAYGALHNQSDYFDRFAGDLAPMIRRPTPLQFADKTTRNLSSSARIFFKREDQRKVTPEAEYALAQAWIAKQLGRGALITGNDVDAHSLGIAIAAQRFKQVCTIVVRPQDLDDKKDFIARLRTLGAQVELSMDESADPRVGALKLWQQARGGVHLALSLGWGPGPFPSMVNDFQSLLGREVTGQVLATAAAEYPLTLVASVGSESDAIGFVLPHLNNPEVELVFAEPEPGGAAAWRPSQRLRVYNGARREHGWLHATGRITHVAIADSQALAMQQQAGSLEDLKLSLEDARALALTSLLVRRDGTARNYVILTG